MTARISRSVLARTAAVLTAAAAVLPLAGCAGTGGSSAAPGKIAVAASTDVWGSVVQAVGGDAVQVSAIIDNPQKDPHDYDFTAQDVTKVTGAQLAIYNGGGYDKKFEDALAQGGGKTKTVNAFQVAGKSSGANEHVFYDLESVKKVADEAAKDLGALAPAQAATFAQNSKDFDAKVDGLIAKAKQAGAAHPGRKAIVTEPVADYLLDTAGVADGTPEAFAKAIEQDADIPPAAQQQTNAALTGRTVQLLVNNAQTETPVTKQLKQAATSAGLPIVDVTETFPPGTTDYLAWMGKNIDGLTAALAK